APGAGNQFADFYRMIAAGGAQADLDAAQADDVEGDALVALEQAVVDQLEVSAPDDRTVVYQLNAPSPVFTVLATLWPLAPAPQHAIEAHGDAWTEPGNLVSNGPFVLAERDHTVGLTLVRNEHWHGEGPVLDELRFEIIGDDAIAFLAYNEDELDVVTLGPTELVQVRGSDLEDEFQSYALLSTVGVFFNFNATLLQDLKVREALAGSFDRVQFAEIVNEGSVLPAYSYLPPGMAGHDPDAGQQFRDAMVRSQELLAEAGYPGGEGFTITLLGANVGGSVTRAEWLKEQWEQSLGITVVLDLIEPSSFVEKLFAGDWDLISGSWTADYPDPQDWLPAFAPGGSLAVGGFEDERFTALLDEAAVELDAARRLELYAEAQRILIDEVAFSPVFYARRNILVKPWVRDFVPAATDGDAPGDAFLAGVSISGRP
ncbi:MAG: peptide ABC transporter substrate-binding protein, partial [Chloroflexi bacterium]|nr:peptide ABC transporter substrate-binding protein [Chloroflexota bacterium]